MKKQTYILIGVVFLVLMILNVINVVYYKSGSMQEFWNGTLRALVSAVFYLGIAYFYRDKNSNSEQTT